MWVMCREGFFSVVCAREGDGGHGSRVDLDRVMVRARSRAHLEGLCEQFPELVKYGVKTTEQTDYRHRIIIPKGLWVRIAAGLANDIAYPNFKNEVAEVHGRGSSYDVALHSVWSVMLRLQTSETRPR